MTGAINPALASRPTLAGSESHGFAWKGVTVRSVNTDTRLALVIDDLGKRMEVRCDIIRAKGNLPEPGEQWIIDRSLGIWTFAAIINGTTRGVEVSNVTDLPEALLTIDNTAEQDRLNALAQANSALATATANTNGKIVAKGDLLAGTTSTTVQRQAAGVDGSVVVYDSTQVTGITSRVPLALTAPLNTSVNAAGRYVGNTVSGPPTSGAFLKGDWVTDQAGFNYICTVAGSPGTWVTKSVDPTRVTNAETNVSTLQGQMAAAQGYGKHIWYSNDGICAPNTTYVPPGYSVQVNDGIAAIVGASFQFRRVGRWAINASCFSNSTALGISTFYLQFGSPSPTGFANAVIADRRYRHPGTAFTASGYLEQNITWVGQVTAAPKDIIWTPSYQWNCPTAGANAISINIQIGMEYLGPF